MAIDGLGLTWLLVRSIPSLGKLSVGVSIKQENFRFCFPLTMCIVLSLLMIVVFWPDSLSIP